MHAVCHNPTRNPQRTPTGSLKLTAQTPLLHPLLLLLWLITAAAATTKQHCCSCSWVVQ